MAAVQLDDSFGNLHINGPPPPPMPSSFTAGNPPPPPPPPGLGAGMSYKEQRDKTFEEQQMANLPSGLMTTAAKADKKPFSYTPVGLSAADLRAPSSIRKDKLEAIASGEEVPTPGVVPGIPRGPTNVRIFNGITPPASSFDSSGVARNSPMQARRNSLQRQDSGGSATGSDRGGRVAPIQSRSFKILQWMTGADADDDSILAGTASPPVSKPNEDEMRFSGYNRADSIPSRAYQTLEKNVAQHVGNSSPSAHQQSTVQPFRDENFRTEFNDETGSNARYTGNTIPSRSFRALQNMTGPEGTVPSTLHARPPSPTMGRRSPNPALVQPHFARNTESPNMAPPNQQDFRYHGPQYSTYDLPPAQHHNYAPSPGIMSHGGQQPRFSSSVSLIPGGGDQRRPEDYADQSSSYRPAGNAYNAPQSPYSNNQGYPSQAYTQPAQQQLQYGGNSIPSRSFQQAMTGGGHHSSGRSDF